jgi:torulene dioxygenase
MQVEQLVSNAQETDSVGSHITFGERDPCDTLYRKVKSTFSSSRTHEGLHANIGVAFRRPLASEEAALKKAGHAISDVLAITTDNATVKHMNAASLEPLDVTTQAVLHPDLGGQMSAAHACEDAVTGDIFNYNLTLGPTHVYR